MVEHYVNGQRVYTLTELSDLTHVAEATLRQRVKRQAVEAAGWINPRLPVYRAADLGVESALSAAV